MFIRKKKYIVFLFLFTFLQSEDFPKIGLVLSGGGSKGFAHIATLKALDSLKIPIDYIAGTSFGAITGAMYALGYSGKQIEKMAIETDWYEVQKDEPERKYLPYFRKKDTGKYQLTFDVDGVKPVAPTGLIYGQKIILDLSKWTREYEQIYDFDLLPIPFRCNAFDIISGKEVIIKAGSLSHALRASLSIPTIFAPVEWGDALLVDGGVANNLPVDIVKDMGADIILAVDVSSTTQSKSNLINMYDIIDQTISVHGYEKKLRSIDEANYYIRPEIGNISFTDYRIQTMHYLFDCGEEAVKSNWDIFLDLKNITSERKINTSEMRPLEKPFINGIKIQGNEEITEKFIRQYIGLEKGLQLNVEILDKNISELYSLGYFKTLYYEIHPFSEGWVNLIIHVKEGSLRKFHLGLRWDNLYHLVGVANVQLNTKWIPGVRIEDEIQFAGIRKNEFAISYPSRRLNFPIYPYFKITNLRYPFKVYSASENYGEPYTYSSNGIRTGLGVLLRNYWNTEFEYFLNKVNFQSEKAFTNQDDNNFRDDSNSYSIKKKNITGFRMLAKLDLLDNILLPKEGILLKWKYENSRKDLGSVNNYHLYQFSGKIYKTFRLNTYGIMGYYHQTVNEFPGYITAISKGSNTFAGMKEFQLHGSILAFSRLEYRYKHKKDIFFHFMVNWLMSAKSEDFNHTAENLWGLGMGITLLSPVGPLEFIWSWGPKNIYTNRYWQNLYYFSAGYKF